MQVTARFQLVVNDVETGWRMVQVTMPGSSTPTDIMEKLFVVAESMAGEESYGGGEAGDIVIDTIVM